MANLVTTNETTLHCVKKLQHDDKNSGSSQNKSHVRCSSSSRYEDKSEHYFMLLKEKEQCLSSRDVLIGMLQEQLKKMEDHYKKSLDDHQEMRYKYSSVVQELGSFKLICQKLEEDKKKVTNPCQNITKLKQKLEATRTEAERWKSDYDSLARQFENKSRTNDHNNLQPLIEQFKNIQHILLEQNDKLNDFIVRFDHPCDDSDHCLKLKQHLEVLKSSHDQIHADLANIASEKGFIDQRRNVKNYCCLNETDSCIMCTDKDRIVLEETVERQNGEIEVLKLELEKKCVQLCEVLAQNRDALSENSNFLRKYEDSIDNLNHRYNSAMQELDNVKASNVTLQDQFQNLQELLKHHKKEAEYSKNELDKSNKYIDNLKAVVINLENELKEKDFDLDQKLKESLRIKEDLETRLEKLQKLVKDLNHDNTNLLTQIDERDQQIKILLTQVHTLQTELEKVRDDIKDFNDNSTQEVEQLMCICQELNEKLKETKEELTKQATRVSTTKEDYEKLLAINSSMKQEMQTIEMEANEKIAKLQTSITTKEAEKTKLIDENDYLKTQLDVELSAHDRETQKFKRSLDEHKTENNEIKLKLKQMAKEILDCTNSENGKLKKINALKEELQRAQRDKHLLEEKLDITNKELDILRQTGKSTSLLKIENSKLKDKVCNLENRVSLHPEQSARIAELQFENEQLKAKIANLEKSIVSKTATIEQCFNTCKLAPIVEERNSCNALIRIKPLGGEEDKLDQDLDKYSITAQVTILYDNQQFQNGEESDAMSNKSAECRDCPKRLSGENSKVETLQVRLDRINQMEKQVETMISVIKDQNKRMCCNRTTCPKEKDTKLLNNRAEVNKKKKDGLTYQKNPTSKGPVRKTNTPNKSSDGSKSPRVCSKCPHGHRFASKSNPDMTLYAAVLSFQLRSAILNPESICIVTEVT